MGVNKSPKYTYRWCISGDWKQPCPGTAWHRSRNRTTAIRAANREIRKDPNYRHLHRFVATDASHTVVDYGSHTRFILLEKLAKARRSGPRYEYTVRTTETVTSEIEIHSDRRLTHEEITNRAEEKRIAGDVSLVAVEEVEHTLVDARPGGILAVAGDEGDIRGDVAG